jgi:hypothetical protein
MKRRNSGRLDREVHVSLETSRVGEQCLNDSYEHLLPWRRPRREQARDSLRQDGLTRSSSAMPEE